jgi:hypothetical protein
VVSCFRIFSGFIFYDDIDELRQRKELPKGEDINDDKCCSFMFTQKEIPHVAVSIVLA